MLSRKVKATLGGFWNYEGIQLQRKHKMPTIIRVDQAGVPTYDELVIVAEISPSGMRAPASRRRCRSDAWRTSRSRALAAAPQRR